MSFPQNTYTRMEKSVTPGRVVSNFIGLFGTDRPSFRRYNRIGDWTNSTPYAGIATSRQLAGPPLFPSLQL